VPTSPVEKQVLDDLAAEALDLLDGQLGCVPAYLVDL
jgi:hypothetical protein